MSYSCLIGEMEKHGITKKSIAKTLGLHRNTIAYKLKKGYFSIEEAEKIKKSYFPNVPISRLFEKK